MSETETIVEMFRDKLFEWFNSDEIFDSRAYNTCKPYQKLVDELEGTVNKIADELKARH